MRIAVLISKYHPWIGGAEIFAKHVAEHMVGEGHEVDVITGLWNGPDAKALNVEENLNGVQIFRTSTLNIRYIKTLSCIVPILNKAINLDIRRDYDVVHAHIFPAMQAGALVKKFLRKTILTTVQGGDLADYGATAKFGGILKPMISWSLKNSDMVHAVSKYVENKARELGSEETIVIPNGVDAQRFKPLDKDELRKRYGIPHDMKVIITVSRLTEKNGVNYLIRAMAALRSETKLLILGEGHQRPALEALIKKLDLQRKVDMLGSIPHEEIPKYLNIADIFVRPSLSEGFGIAFIEAMACGIPVIGTPVGGIPEIIREEENGILVPPADVEELVDAINTLLEDNGFRERLGKRARKDVEGRFSWNVILREMGDLYENLM